MTTELALRGPFQTARYDPKIMEAISLKVEVAMTRLARSVEKSGLGVCVEATFSENTPADGSEPYAVYAMTFSVVPLDESEAVQLSV